MQIIHKHILHLIKEKTKVIDIGCADGCLAKLLQKEKLCKLQAIEINPEFVRQSISNGIATILGEAPEELQPFSDNVFDYAILSDSLQVMANPREVLEQALRIARSTILIVPNFGNIKNRIYLGFRGKMPVTKELSYQWYETPNIHFSTLLDIKNLCEEMQADITEKYIIRGEKLKRFKYYLLPNLFADKILLILQKAPS